MAVDASVLVSQEDDPSVLLEVSSMVSLQQWQLQVSFRRLSWLFHGSRSNCSTERLRSPALACPSSDLFIQALSCWSHQTHQQHVRTFDTQAAKQRMSRQCGEPRSIFNKGIIHC